MWEWVVQNKQWIFSGAGLTALAVVWWLINKFSPKHEAATSTTQVPNTVQSPNTTIAPVITVSPTIQFRNEPHPELPKTAPLTRPPSTTPKTRHNLCVEATKIGKVALQGDIWTLNPNPVGWNRPQHYRALLADISNVPTEDTHTARAAIRAAIRMDHGGRLRTYSPLPWLEEYRNVVHLETGGRKTVVLAVGEDSKTGIWKFVLNHRSSDSTGGEISEMDWTNPCPIPSDIPFEILMIDMNTGALLSTFKYFWTFDAQNNWPILKSPD